MRAECTIGAGWDSDSGTRSEDEKMVFSDICARRLIPLLQFRNRLSVVVPYGYRSGRALVERGDGGGLTAVFQSSLSAVSLRCAEDSQWGS